MPIKIRYPDFLRSLGYHLLVVISVACISSCSASNEDNVAIDWSAVETKIKPAFQDFMKENSPGAGIAVLHRGEVVMTSVFGHAIPEEGIPFTEHSRVPIASITKSIVADAYLQLEKQKRINFDSGVRSYLPELSSVFDQVTIRHLLMQTSGIWQDEDVVDLAGGATRELPRDGGVHRVDAEAFRRLALRQDKLIFAPGSTYMYTDTNYRLLGEILERITEKDIASALEELVYKPRSITGASFSPWYSDLDPGEVPTYFGNLDDGYLSRRIISYAGHGDSGARISLNQLATWLSSVSRSNDTELSSVWDMIGPHQLSDGRISPYGIGIYLSYDRDVDIVSWCHGSATGSRYCVIPEYDLAYAYVSNWRGQANPSRTLSKVVPIIIEQLEAHGYSRTFSRPHTLNDIRRTEDPVRLPQGLTGLWASPENALTIHLKNDEEVGSYAEFLGRRTPLTEMNTQQFISSQLSSTHNFDLIISEGQPVLKYGGESYPLKKVMDIQKDSMSIPDGLYYNQQMKAVYEISTPSDHQTLTIGSGINPSQNVGIHPIGHGIFTTPDRKFHLEMVETGMLFRSRASGLLLFEKLERQDN